MVSRLLSERFSCRSFDSRPVDVAAIRAAIELANRAPSGGNTQPWHVHLLVGDALSAFVAAVAQRGVFQEEALPFPLYPPASASKLYMERRIKVASSYYELANVSDKAGKQALALRNFSFFGAPAAIFVTVDKIAAVNGWAHAGLFAMALQLQLQSQGLSTCFQEAWANIPSTVRELLSIPDDQIVWCAIAIGHADASPVNRIRTERRAFDDFVSLIAAAPKL
jgi:nitroreductase